MSPDQCPSEGMRVLSAIHKVFDDGVRAPSIFCSAVNTRLHIEFTIMACPLVPSGQLKLTGDDCSPNLCYALGCPSATYADSP